MRILLIYDCLYPNTVGGAELWLRALAERLSGEHEVTYLTRRQWPRGESPGADRFEVVAVSPGGTLYTPAGRRRLLPAIAFGAGVLGHLIGRRGRYDVVHCLSYPYLSVLAARLALLGRREKPRLYVEWLECLSPGWWRAYAGRLAGALGLAVQRLCVLATPVALVFSDHTAARVRASGLRGEPVRLPGLFAGPAAPAPEVDRDGDLVLFAGRHTPDKRPVAAVEALAAARARRPNTRGVIVGDGPERPRVLARIRELGLEGAVEAPGFVERGDLEALLRRAACLLAPSLREGFGMTVLEATAFGTPAVVCEAPDNAAAELIEPGVNGRLAADPSPEAIGEALVAVLEAGDHLRRTTADWFGRNRDGLSMDGSLEAVERLYRESSRTASTNAS